MLARLPLLWLVAFLLCCSCRNAKASFAATEVFEIPFRVAENTLIVVPVRVNGAGPFDFALDTGSSDSSIDEQLAEQLALPISGTSAHISILERSDRRLVHSNTLSVGKGTVGDLDLAVRENMHGSVLKVFGILGEDYLKQFDLMIDNHHHVVLFDAYSGSLALRFQGEHLGIATAGNYRGGHTRNRLILNGYGDEFGNAAFLLDSGANNVYFFLPLRRWHVWGLPFASIATNISGSTNTLPARTQFVRVLSFGKKRLADISAIAPSGPLDVDVDALLPTRIFDRIFICHSGNYVILDPTSKRR
jgi:hypothetical protein